MAKAKDISHLPENEQEKVLEYRRKRAEYMKSYSKKMTPEQRRKMLAKKNCTSQSRRASMSDEVVASIRAHNRAYQQARRDAMSSEELEGRREYARKRYRAMSVEERRAMMRRTRESEKARRLRDPQAALAWRIRNRVRKLFRGELKGKKPGSILGNLGCSIPELRSYLEHFFQTDMSWDNYGEWHIDHRIPLSHFDLTDPDQFLMACSYRNLQPLWRDDNWAKQDRWADPLGPTLEEIGLRPENRSPQLLAD